jgi:hypothetical protein
MSPIYYRSLAVICDVTNIVHLFSCVAMPSHDNGSRSIDFSIQNLWWEWRHLAWTPMFTAAGHQPDVVLAFPLGPRRKIIHCNTTQNTHIWLELATCPPMKRFCINFHQNRCVCVCVCVCEHVHYIYRTYSFLYTNNRYWNTIRCIYTAQRLRISATKKWLGGPSNDFCL